MLFSSECRGRVEAVLGKQFDANQGQKPGKVIMNSTDGDNNHVSSEDNQYVSTDKRADILQGTFEHYYGMAMDHHTKAGTTTNILLGIVAAVLVLLGYDEKVCRDFVDIGATVAVIIIGLFGAAWVWKQIERYKYWAFIADRYQAQLIEIWPEFNSRDVYKHRAHAASVRASTYPHSQRPDQSGISQEFPLPDG
jgi:hypothetical protein